jgi:hypothetical protein
MTTHELQPTAVVTEDMRLPAGSSVIQCILHRSEEGAFMDVRCMTIGGTELDMGNPTHRFMMAVHDRIEEIMAQVAGGPEKVFALDASEVEERLMAANEVMNSIPQPGDLLHLSDGTTIAVADESEDPRQVLADASAELGRQEDAQILPFAGHA